jgi:hypothetical protein
VVALTPHERINTGEAFFICDAAKVDVVITDEDGKALAEDSFRDSGIAVL